VKDSCVKPIGLAASSLVLFLCLGVLSYAPRPAKGRSQSAEHASVPIETAQVPSWSRGDMDFFLHGSMSTEMVPETVLRAFIRAWPDLFPTYDLSHLGLIPDPAFGWPVGFSRSPVPHLGGLPAVGLNCAACHVREISSMSGGPRVRVLGVTSHFDAEAFFGAVILATFRTAAPTNMQRFLAAYLVVNDPASGQQGQQLFQTEWQRQEQAITAAIAAEPSGSKDLPPGALHSIAGADLRLDRQLLAGGADLAAISHNFLRLFHNVRASLHVPDQPPNQAPPASGPGRNDAFGLLSAVLFGAPQPYFPVKYGLVWNLDQRRWVHWDGNTQSPLGRNLLASLGLGAPLLGKHAQLDLALVQRQTALSQGIRSPRYPFAIDLAASQLGAAHYQTLCASCHDGPEGNQRLHSPAESGTDPHRAELFTQLQAERFDTFLATLETPGYQPSKEPGIRSTQKYWAASMSGVWARSPYLHNGLVRTMQQLLAPPPDRAKSFRRGSRSYDPDQMGYSDDGGYVLDTTAAGNSNAGHDYGTGLLDAQKRELIEYLKTR
jgi:cytochrome c553